MLWETVELKIRYYWRRFNCSGEAIKDRSWCGSFAPQELEVLRGADLSGSPRKRIQSGIRSVRELVTVFIKNEL